MRKVTNNLTFKYQLVLCLGIALLLAQAGKLHMHLVHDEHSGSAAHIVAVHPESTRHDFELTNHHDSHAENHAAGAVDVSLDKLVKKTNFLSPLVIALFFMGFLLCVPRRMGVFRQPFVKTLFSSCYYLFRPPLRAPPIK